MGEWEVGASDSRFTSSSEPRMCVVGVSHRQIANRVMALWLITRSPPPEQLPTQRPGASHLRELTAGNRGSAAGTITRVMAVGPFATEGGKSP
jgi:hypothetical protein